MLRLGLLSSWAGHFAIQEEPQRRAPRASIRDAAFIIRSPPGRIRRGEQRQALCPPVGAARILLPASPYERRRAGVPPPVLRAIQSLPYRVRLIGPIGGKLQLGVRSRPIEFLAVQIRLNQASRQVGPRVRGSAAARRSSPLGPEWTVVHGLAKSDECLSRSRNLRKRSCDAPFGDRKS